MRAHKLTWTNERESTVVISFNLDGKGECQANTGIAVFNHLLETFTRYGRFDLHIEVKGDTIAHHIFEHTGLVMGLALAQSLGDRRTLRRFSRVCVPMDETVVDVALDINNYTGRYTFQSQKQLIKLAKHHSGIEIFSFFDFIQQLVLSSSMNLHILRIISSDIHHAIEATYKAVAMAVYEASRVDENPIAKLTPHVD